MFFQLYDINANFSCLFPEILKFPINRFGNLNDFGAIISDLGVALALDKLHNRI